MCSRYWTITVKKTDMVVLELRRVFWAGILNWGHLNISTVVNARSR